VTTPPYPELVAAVRQEGEAILAASRQDLDAAVTTCGDWKIRDLLGHVGSVFRRAATLVEERITTELAMSAPPDDLEDPVGYMSEALDDLVAALSSAEPDTPVWNWSTQPHVAAFWARRMAHEATIHRYDAQRAFGVAQPLDADLAEDGFDELVDVLLPRIISRDSPTLPSATYCFSATDDGDWTLRTESAEVERLELGTPDVTVRGTASALLLAAYNRVKWTSLEVEGNTELLDLWSTLIHF
jgi:uncharacterized protein (TIGR03083 family)